MLGRLNEDIALLARAIRWGEGDKLLRPLHPHPRHPPRHHLVGQETPEPDFGRRRARISRRGDPSSIGPASSTHWGCTKCGPRAEHAAVLEPQRRQGRRAPAWRSARPLGARPWPSSAPSRRRRAAAGEVAEKPVEAGGRDVELAGRPVQLVEAQLALGLDPARALGERQHQDVELAAGRAPALQLLRDRAAREALGLGDGDVALRSVGSAPPTRSSRSGNAGLPHREAPRRRPSPAARDGIGPHMQLQTLARCWRSRPASAPVTVQLGRLGHEGERAASPREPRGCSPAADPMCPARSRVPSVTLQAARRSR